MLSFQFLVNKEGVPVKRYSPTTAPLVSVFRKFFCYLQSFLISVFGHHEVPVKGSVVSTSQTLANSLDFKQQLDYDKHQSFARSRKSTKIHDFWGSSRFFRSITNFCDCSQNTIFNGNSLINKHKLIIN